MATDDSEIVELSTLLRSAAPAGFYQCARYRNPHGVWRKVRRFLDHLSGSAGSPLSAVEESVQEEFAGKRRRLAAEAMRARRRLAAAAERPDAPSRGPAPASFLSLFCDDEGLACLYVAALGGVVLEGGEIFVKIGRSNNIRRREKDLNFAFPQRLGLRWRMIAAWQLQRPMLAHLAEQTILQSEAAAGRSAGGEFLLMAQSEIGGLLRRCRQIIQPVTIQHFISSPRPARARTSANKPSRQPDLCDGQAAPRGVRLAQSSIGRFRAEHVEGQVDA